MAQLKHVSTKGKLGVNHDEMALFYSSWFNNKLVAFNRFVGMLAQLKQAMYLQKESSE